MKSAFWLGQNVPKIVQSFPASSGAQVSQTAPELLFPSLDGMSQNMVDLSIHGYSPNYVHWENDVCLKIGYPIFM